MNTLLSKNFSLSELTHSDIALQHNINNCPDVTSIQHLKLLCVDLLQPIRDFYGKPIRVTSGFRCPYLNDVLLHANPNSAHTQGFAADIIPADPADMTAFKQKVKHFLTFYGIPFDQCIDERNEQGNEWMHVSLISCKGEQRRQFLITKNGHTYQKDNTI